MFKKTVFVLIIGVMALSTLAGGSLVQAQGGTDFTGTIDDSSGCVLIGIPGNAYPAHITAFTVPVTGSYTFTYQFDYWDGQLYSLIFEGSFDPSMDAYSQNPVEGPSSFPQSARVVTLNLQPGTYHLMVRNDQVWDTYPECLTRTSTRSGPYRITSDIPSANSAPRPEGGCDLFVKRPANAVVGTFTGWADLYWMPGEKIIPPLTMEPGQSVWVLGQDETGMYRKIQLSCEFLWVEAGVIGPNYDEVWNGAPLPTDVVQ